MSEIMNRFHWEAINSFDGRVIDTYTKTEILALENLFLKNTRLRPFGEIIIGEEVPMPLFWRQYANHQNPERNAGILKSIYVTETKDKILFHITSTNHSESILSKYEIQISYSEDLESYEYLFNAELKVNLNKEWRLTYNPTHGEIEFCNFYPAGTFSKNLEIENKFNYCVYENTEGKMICLPHIHLETEEYKNLPIKIGGNFYYLLEDENPVIQLIQSSHDALFPGICSYMWDSHFGFRKCDKDQTFALAENENYSVSFRIYTIPRKKGTNILRNSKIASFKDISSIPVYTSGINSFNKNIFDFKNIDQIWPWQTEDNIKDRSLVKYSLDKITGYSDSYSLFINLNTTGFARWIYTALGPDYGKAPFQLNSQFILKIFYKLHKSDPDTFIRIGFRIHYKDENNLFDINNYTTFYSDKLYDTGNEWKEYIYQIPVFSKLPDRVHLLLELSNPGMCWFDDILFEII